MAKKMRKLAPNLADGVLAQTLYMCVQCVFLILVKREA